MERFRMRLYEIEAEQITEEAAIRHLLNEQQLPFGLSTASATYNPTDRTVSRARFFIETAEGIRYADVGSWVVRYGDQVSILTDAQFRLTYEGIPDKSD